MAGQSNEPFYLVKPQSKSPSTCVYDVSERADLPTGYAIDIPSTLKMSI